MPSRDFDAARAERRREVDPIRFTLGGETFVCVARIPVGHAFDLMDAPELTPTNYAECARALDRFIMAVLLDDVSRERWQALLRRVDDPIDDWALIEVGTWLAEAYSGTPFDGPDASFPGRRDAGGSLSSTATPTDSASLED